MLSFNLNSVKLDNVSVESTETDRSSNDALRDIDLWHLRLGHLNESALKSTLLSCNQVKLNKNFVPSFFCACQYRKQSKQNFKSTETKTSKALELIHADLWRPAPIPSSHDIDITYLL